MFELQYVVLGIVQGITEFLPISSSAHLILVSELSNWDDQGIFTDIAVHVGTLGAVIIYLFRDINKIIVEFFQFKQKSFRENNYQAIKIVVATIPALVIGFFVYEYFIAYLRDVIVIACSSIVFAIILYIVDRQKISTKQWRKLNFTEVLLVGLCQSLAFIPGASRAGIVITGARFFNVKRDSAAIFSMLLSIPIILASISLALFDIISLQSIDVNFTKPILSACIAFVTALLSIHFMMKLLQKNNFNIFIIYRLILGITLLIFYV